MSVNMDAGGVSYADHDVQHIRHGLRWLDSADSGPSDIVSDERQFEITERGLDPDELAELRAMRVSVSTTQLTTTNQGLPGTVVGTVDAGFNLSGDEFLFTARDAEDIDVDNSGTDDIKALFRDTDEVGQLYTTQVQETVSFGDNGNSVGGAANDTSQNEMLNFADLFGSGPFVDSADDFTSRIALIVNDVLDSVQVDATYSLYYDVNQTEGGRSRFGR